MPKQFRNYMYFYQDFLGKRNILCDAAQKGKNISPTNQNSRPFWIFGKNIGICVPPPHAHTKKRHIPIIGSSNPTRMMYRRH